MNKRIIREGGEPKAIVEEDDEEDKDEVKEEKKETKKEKRTRTLSILMQYAQFAERGQGCEETSRNRSNGVV